MKEGRCKVLDVDAVIAICVCVYVLRTRTKIHWFRITSKVGTYYVYKFTLIL